MTAFKYIEESGQSYLQCQIEAKSYNKNKFIVKRVNGITYSLYIGVDKLCKIPSRGSYVPSQTEYKKVCQIIIN